MSKIIIFGHSWITIFLINCLIKRNLKPILIVAMPFEKSKSISGYLDLTEVLKTHNIKLYNPKSYSLKNNKGIKYLENIDFDYGLVFGWSRLIPGRIIRKAKKAVLGVHGGPYPPPRCRGRAVFNWALIDGFDSFILYIFKISPGIDDGEIYIIKKFEITKLDNIESIYDKHSIISTNMFIEVLKNWKHYSINGIKQDEQKATYMPARSPNDGGICWDDTTENIYNFVRALAKPFPNAYTEYNNNKLYIQNAIPFNDIELECKEPGNIGCVFGNKNFVVETGDGFFVYQQVQFSKPNRIEEK